MKNILKRIRFILMVIILFLTTLSSPIPITAEEYEPIDFVDEIYELGTYEEVFENSNPRLRNNPAKGERYGMIFIDNQYGYDYITHFYINGETVFCLDPMSFFNVDSDYPVDTVYWDNLSEYQRQAIWEVAFYGYLYSGHQSSKFYVATQIMIWEIATGSWHQPYELDRSTPIDIGWEVSEINRLRSQPLGRPSFHNQTLDMGYNIPMTITDTKGVLGNFNVTSGNGVNISVSGNNLTATITSENYSNNITFTRTEASKKDVNIVYGSGGDQRVLYLAKRTDPTYSYRLNFNLLYATVEVTKDDIETGDTPQGDATFNGAKFEITNYTGNVVETITTTGNKVTSKGYPVGTSITVCEVEPPEGYLLNEECNEIELLFDGSDTILKHYTTISNQVIKGQIEIAKSFAIDPMPEHGSNIQFPGQDFVFDIYLKSSGELVSTITTNEDGRAITPLLPYGTYTVIEQEKHSFDTLEPFDVFISEDGKIYFYSIYNDTHKAELTIYKTDGETGKVIPASGVEFKLKDEDGNFVVQTVTYPTKYDTDTFITDENGSVHLPDLLVFGTYYITEISAPYGYWLTDEEVPVYVDGSSTELFIDFDNVPVKGQLQIEKFGEQFVAVEETETDYGIMYVPIYQEKYLDNVTFQIIAREDIVGQEGTVHYLKGDVVDTFTTKDTEPSLSEFLPLGAYSVQEIDTKSGFVLDETVYDFDFEYEGQLIKFVYERMVLTNQRQTLELEFSKLFEDKDKDAWKDIVFGIYTNEDIYIDEEIVIPSDSLVGLITLDENGNPANQVDLPLGDYYLKELETNIGFVLNEDNHEFTFTHDSVDKETSVIKIEDIYNEKRRVDIEIVKVDKDNHEYRLNNAVFEVTDKTTGKYLGILCTGKLAIRDTAPNIEYEISLYEDFETIYITALTDSENEIILSVSQGVYYARRTGSDEVTRIVVTNGSAILHDAIYGHEYEFKEIQAPTSYKKRNEPFVITCIADKDVNKVSFTFENERIKVPNTSVE